MLRFLRRRLVRLGKDERGFTIVELLVVITVVGILAGVGVSGYTNFRERANKTAADAAWRDLQVAISLYEVETGDPFPYNKVNDDDDEKAETTKAISDHLIPPPEALRTNLWTGTESGIPATDGDGRLVPGENDPSTGFVAGEVTQGTETTRFTCVWVSSIPSRFNETFGELCGIQDE